MKIDINPKDLAEMLQYADGQLRYAEALSRKVAGFVAAAQEQMTPADAPAQEPALQASRPTRKRRPKGEGQALVWQVFEATEEVLPARDIIRHVHVTASDMDEAYIYGILSQLCDDNRIRRVSYGHYQRVPSKPHLAFTARASGAS